MGEIVKKAEQALRVYADPVKRDFFPKFFKTGPGEYGEGDEFLGVTVPNIRIVMREYRAISFGDLRSILASPKHEIRLMGVFILVWKFERAHKDSAEQKRIIQFYFKEIRAFNNWDIVDSGVFKIVGNYLIAHPEETTSLLTPLIKHKSVWRRRIALLGHSHYAIRTERLDEAVAFFEHFIEDKHDLIHKALGWMMRDLGQRDLPRLKRFLDQTHTRLSSVTISYATEKIPQAERKKYYKRQVK